MGRRPLQERDMAATAWFDVDEETQQLLLQQPYGSLRYASLDYACVVLPDVAALFRKMAGTVLQQPRVTFRRLRIPPGGVANGLDWHCDGKQTEEERHHLLCVGPTGTLGRENGQIVVLRPGTVWCYDGRYEHKQQSYGPEGGERVILRVSQTTMTPRNIWFSDI
jgi:hypothetical protein